MFLGPVLSRWGHCIGAIFLRGESVLMGDSLSRYWIRSHRREMMTQCERTPAVGVPLTIHSSALTVRISLGTGYESPLRWPVSVCKTTEVGCDPRRLVSFGRGFTGVEMVTPGAEPPEVAPWSCMQASVWVVHRMGSDDPRAGPIKQKTFYIFLWWVFFFFFLV